MDIIDKVFAKLNKEEIPGDLRARILNIPQQKKKMGFDWSKLRIYSLRLGMPLLVFALIAGTVFYQNFKLANYAAAFELEATDKDSAGVAPQSKFVLKSSKNISERDVKKIVKFEPELKFDVKSLGDNRYELIPTEVLAKNQIYRINIEQGPGDREYAWAYQVKAPFAVLSSIPGNKGNNVPANTGIEITFNRESLVQPEKFFQIDPKVEGSFEQYGRTLIFKPAKPLEVGRVYTVTVKKGLGAKDSNDTLPEDHSFKFQVGEGELTTNYSWSLAQDNYQFLPDTNPLFRAYTNSGTSWDLNAKVYDFKNGEDFVKNYVESHDWDFDWSDFSRKQFRENVSKNLRQISESDIEVKKINNSDFIELPNKLNSGYYLVVLENKVGNDSYYDFAWLQVTPLAHYSAFSYEKSVVWLYDFTKKQPIENAEVSLVDGSKLAETNKEGLTEFNTPDVIRDEKSTAPYNYTMNYNKPTYFRIEKKGYLPYYFPFKDQTMYYWGASGVRQSDPYWKSLNFDRPAYLPDDNVNFWGVLKARKGNVSGEKLSVGIYQNDYKYFYGYNSETEDEQRPIVSAEVKLSGNSTYEGSLSYKGLNPGYYMMSVKLGDKQVDQVYFQVLSYSKPVYRMSVEADRNSVFSGEKVNFKVKASYYDGSPVKNLAMTYNISGSAASSDFKLNENGEGNFAVTFTAGNDGHSPQYEGVSVQAKRSEEAEMSMYTGVRIFAARTHLEVMQNVKRDGTGIFTAKVNKVDMTKAQDSEYSDFLGDAVTNHVVEAEITKITQEQIKTGEYYDYISKTTQPTYTYSEKKEVIEKVSGKTNGKGEWVLERKFDDDKANYTLKFTTKDEQGKVARAESWYFRGGYYGDPVPGVAMNKIRANGQEFSATVGQGEKYLLEVTDGENTAREVNKTMFLSYQSSITDSKIVEGSKLEENFDKQDKPALSHIAVNISKYGFEPTQPVLVSYNLDEAKLKVELKAEREHYKPGEEVKIDVKVRDHKDNGVKTEVNLSAVDQAIFDYFGDGDIEDKVVYDLYRHIIVEPAMDYVRFDQNYLNRSADGKGGGGPDTPRVDMKDSALFKTVQTDGSGQATLSFKLPDNLTEWRIAAIAYDFDDLRAGGGKTKVVSRLPLGIDSTLNETYLENDQPVLRLRLHGSEFDSKKKTEIKVLNTELGINVTEQISGSEAQIQLPALKRGIYNLDIQAKQGESFDHLIEKVVVLKTYFERPENKQYTVKEGLSGIEGAERGLTKLIVSDQGAGKYVPELSYQSYLSGTRADQVAASHFARKTLHEQFGLGDDPKDLDLAIFRQSNGYALMSYGSTEHELSAQITALYPDLFYSKQLSPYFYQSLTDPKSDLHMISQSIFALAYMNEPVLIKAQLLSGDPMLSIEDRTYLALAMAKLGDKEGARVIFRQLSNELKKQEDQAWYDKTAEQTRKIKITSLVGVLASELNEHNDLQKIWNYLLKNFPQKENNYLEKSLLVKAALENNKSKDAKFSYEIGKEKKEVVLRNGQQWSLELMPDDLKQFKIRKVNGDLALFSLYEAPSEPADNTGNLKLSRQYLVNDKATTSFKDGDIIKVKMTVDLDQTLKGNTYQVTDFMPAGLKPVTSSWYPDLMHSYGYGDFCANRTWYPDQISGNKVTFSISSFEGCNGNQVTIQYYARVVSPGTFRADPALISADADRTVRSISNGATIQIAK
jgi:alpha-2-macroglobulin